MAECKTCHAPIIWAVSLATERRMPVDREPTPLGNVTLDYSGTLPAASVLAGIALSSAREKGVTLHLSHFVTCPDRDQHRKKEEEDATTR